jgi:hypothetical protein
MPLKKYSTEDVARRDSFTYWREMICDVFINLDCSTTQVHPFGGAIQTQVPRADVALHRSSKNVLSLKRSWWKMRISMASIPLAFISQRGSDEDIDRCCDIFGPGLFARRGGHDGMHE